MKPLSEELREIVEAVKKYIELEGLASGQETPAGLSSGSLLSEQGQGPLETGSREPGGSALVVLKTEVLSCVKCELSKTRTHVVFGAGNPKARLMFVGEAPGMQEDLQGLPFVGRAGTLLTKIIESIGLKRDDVYIANVLKCRPPENRNPLPTEILICEEHLIRQIELIKPRVICALGKFAAQTLLRSTETISRLRGKFYDYHGAKLMPTFHPAYLLRNPSEKRLVWEDMKKIRRELK